MAVFELAEVILRIGEAFAGFRFLASKAYRVKTRARWAATSKVQIFIECIGALIGIAFVIVLLYALFRLGMGTVK
jgi:hypothetical protein